MRTACTKILTTTETTFLVILKGAGFLFPSIGFSNDILSCAHIPLYRSFGLGYSDWRARFGQEFDLAFWICLFSLRPTFNLFPSWHLRQSGLPCVFQSFVTAIMAPRLLIISFFLLFLCILLLFPFSPSKTLTNIGFSHSNTGTTRKARTATRAVDAGVDHWSIKRRVRPAPAHILF